MSDTAIYLGPSLHPSDASELLDAEYLPPIKRGDLGRLPEHITTVGIVDGEFFQNLAVTPKEVLELLERGIKVYGASSMGALRAAEAYPYGMTGVGEIFRMYRDGEVDADDEVALIYDPVSYRNISEPLVNVRYALRLAVVKQLISSARAAELVDEMKKLYFPLRSYRHLVQLCPELQHFLAVERPNLKRDDAILLLRAIAS